MKYDVFISYKSEDYKIAANLNRYLTKHGLSVFFSQVSLSERGESEYSNIIDEALEASSHMIVIATKLEYLTRGWVHYEWTSFANDLKCGYKAGNLITLLGPDVKLSELPLGLRHRQSFSTKSYEGYIINYVTESPVVHKRFNHKNPLRLLKYVIPSLIICLLAVFVFDYNQREYPPHKQVYTVDYSDTCLLSIATSGLSKTYDLSRIVCCFEEATDGNSEAQFEIGNFCYEIKNYEDAIYWFAQSAEYGNPRAANGIARCYYNAFGVKQNPRNAFNWFRYSARNGCPEGINNFGKCLEEGYGTLWANKRRAMKCYRSAADLGYAPAQYNVGVHYFFGEGLPLDVEEGLRWLKSAAHLGSPSAQMTLGNIYNEGLQGVPADTTVALAWYKKALENSDDKVRRKVYDKMQKMERK